MRELAARDSSSSPVFPTRESRPVAPFIVDLRERGLPSRPGGGDSQTVRPPGEEGAG